MKKRILKILSVMLLFSVVLSGCIGPGGLKLPQLRFNNHSPTYSFVAARNTPTPTLAIDLEGVYPKGFAQICGTDGECAQFLRHCLVFFTC